MSIEIEAKMPLHDAAALDARLSAVGAERGDVVLEINTFFDTPQNLFKSTDQGLRLRQERVVGSGAASTPGGDERETAIITHKGPRAHGKLKSRSETEVTVNDAEAGAHLLQALGFVRVLSFEKLRRKWELDGCHIAIDTLPLLGSFVEIEGPSDEAVLACREKLNLGAAPLLHASYISMLTTRLAERKQSTNHIALDSAIVEAATANA